MKMFKRFAAALLAGVMVLAMLTACGGGSSTPTSDVEKAEALYMDAYNAALGTNYENNTELKNQAKQLLDKSLDEAGALKSDGKMTVTTKDGKVWTTVTILAQPGNKNVPYGITSEELANMLANKDNVIVNVDATTKQSATGLAVGAVKKGDNIYVAIAMTKEVKLN
jgi:ABC-type oligopeptide transport system substrate-binding subunit